MIIDSELLLKATELIYQLEKEGVKFTSFTIDKIHTGH